MNIRTDDKYVTLVNEYEINILKITMIQQTSQYGKRYGTEVDKNLYRSYFDDIKHIVSINI